MRCLPFSPLKLLTPLFTSDRLERILYQLSEAIVSGISGTHPQRILVPYVLHDLIKLEIRPRCLTEMAYEWCSVICENRNLEDWESLVIVSLEIGFRHLSLQRTQILFNFTHTEHHRELGDVVFKSKKPEAIADLLHAWTARSSRGPLGQEFALLGTCARHLVGLYGLAPFSPRLRHLVIRSVELIGYKGFEEVGVERFIDLLNHLHVTVEDMDRDSRWANILLDTLQSSDGPQHLSHWYWELLVGLEILVSRRPRHDVAYNPKTTAFLTEAQEWSKLECWVGTVWMVWPPGAGETTEEDLGRTMLLLFHQRPRAALKLEQWMGRSDQKRGKDLLKSFQRVCKQAYETGFTVSPLSRSPRML